MDKPNLNYEQVGPRSVSIPVLPQLSDALKDQLSIWEPFSPDALLVLQDTAEDTTETGLELSQKYKNRLQISIGTGWVISKCRDTAHIDERLNDINIGDRVKFPAGTAISAELPNSVPECDLVKILHTQNLIMITRCGPDDPSDILGYQCIDQKKE